MQYRVVELKNGEVLKKNNFSPLSFLKSWMENTKMYRKLKKEEDGVTFEIWDENDKVIKS